MFFHNLKEHFMLTMIWTVAICVSIASYIGLQNSYPTYMQIFLGHTLYAILAMPNAFTHMVGIYIDNTVHRDPFFWLLAAAYWVALGAAHYWYFKDEERSKCTLVIAILVWLGSVKWLFFAVAIMRS